MNGRATMTGNATMTGRATGCPRKVAPEKRIWAIFSCWMVLYGLKQCCMIVAPLWIPHLPIFGKKLTLGPQAPRPLGPFSGHRAGFWPENPFFAIGPWISSMALDDIFDLAPLDRFLNFSFPSYGRFREGDPQNGHILGFPNR